jgi:hypothetical protein
MTLAELFTAATGAIITARGTLDADDCPVLRYDMLTALTQCQGVWFESADADVIAAALRKLRANVEDWRSNPRAIPAHVRWVMTGHLIVASHLLDALATRIDAM